MVKVKIIKGEHEYQQEYIGGVYEAFEMRYSNGHVDYAVKVRDAIIMRFEEEECEVIKDPSTSNKNVEKNINMADIMEGLKIDTDDIVCINADGTKHYLRSNKRHDLILLNGQYDKAVPNLILGMVSGKYPYEVFSLKHRVNIESGEITVNEEITLNMNTRNIRRSV